MAEMQDTVTESGMIIIIIIIIDLTMIKAKWLH